jgi:antitoxin component YwqK of YwqJK toxin-antitoxin module
VTYYPNGQKADESLWTMGKIKETKVWMPNGELCSRSKVNNGNGLRVFYDEDGLEFTSITYKNGEVIE